MEDVYILGQDLFHIIPFNERNIKYAAQQLAIATLKNPVWKDLFLTFDVNCINIIYANNKYEIYYCNNQYPIYWDMFKYHFEKYCNELNIFS